MLHEIYATALITSEAARRRCRVSCVKDTKIENAATLTIQREDHTVGNVLRMCDML